MVPLRRAGRLAAAAVTEAMKATRPGLMEYHLGAVADYVFLVNGARGGGYRPIIACGTTSPTPTTGETTARCGAARWS